MKYRCQSCREILSAEDVMAGKTVGCARCGKPVTIPEGLFAPGSIIADFEIISHIAHGDMGEIYLSEQLSTGRKSALKILAKDHTYDAGFIVSFIHSGRQAMKKTFQNTVQVYAVGEEDGLFYYAMEYVEGISLAETLRKEKKLSLPHSIALIKTIAETLSDAWENGQIIHRSIKPDNILVTTDGVLKLADFGLARDFLDLASRPDEERLRLVQYAPPEALADFSMTSLDIRSDIYSLGAVFYHCVTGKYPYQDFTASEIISGKIPLDLVEPMHLNPDVTPEVQNVIQKMLARLPKDRYQNFFEFFQDFSKLSPAAEKKTAGKSPATHDSITVKMDGGKRAKVNQLDNTDHSDRRLEKMQKRRELRARMIVSGIAAIMVFLGLFFTFFVKWVVYEPQQSSRDMEINIARMTQNHLFGPLQKGATERLSRGVVAHCANEDFDQAEKYIHDFSKKYDVDDSFKNGLLNHVKKSKLFFWQFTNSGSALSGIEFHSRLYGKCKVISVQNSIITAECLKDKKQVKIQIRTFTHPEYESYLRNVISRFGSYSEVRSYLLCTGNFEDALEKVKDMPGERLFFEQVIYGYIRTGLSNASPLEIRQMRMLYGSLDAFQKATHPNE